MKEGDFLVCTRSSDNFYIVGKKYRVEGFDIDGDPLLRDEYGELDEEYGQPFEGWLWDFKEVDPE